MQTLEIYHINKLPHLVLPNLFFPNLVLTQISLKLTTVSVACQRVMDSIGNNTNVLSSPMRREHIPPTLAIVLQLPIAVFRMMVGKSSAVYT
jgi:hypothetical protein